MVDQFEEEKIAYGLHQVLRIDLRFSFYCSGSKMLKNRSKQNSYRVISFIITERKEVPFGAFD